MREGYGVTIRTGYGMRRHLNHAIGLDRAIRLSRFELHHKIAHFSKTLVCCAYYRTILSIFEQPAYHCTTGYLLTQFSQYASVCTHVNAPIRFALSGGKAVEIVSKSQASGIVPCQSPAMLSYSTTGHGDP